MASSRHLRPIGPLRQPPVDALQQVTELCCRDRHRLTLGARPHEAPSLQPLGQQAHPLAIVPKDLQQPAALAAEHEQVATVRIAPERLLHQQRKAIEAAAHIRHAAPQPYPRLGRQPDHPPTVPPARTTRPNAASSTAASTRTRTLPASSISI